MAFYKFFTGIVWLTCSATAAIAQSNIIDQMTEDVAQAQSISRSDCASVTNVTSPVRAGSKSFRHYVDNCGYRAELSARPTEIGKAYWYGWSVYLPSDWNNKGGFNIIMQLAAYPSPRDGKFPCGGSGHKISISTGGQVEYDLQYQGTSTDSECREYPLASASDMKGKWTDFVIHAKWTGKDDRSGYLELWMKLGNGDYVRKFRYDGPTWWNDEDLGPYFKMGSYLGKGHDGWSGPDRILYTDEYRLGNANASFAEVAPGGGTPPAPANQAPVASFAATPVSGAAPLAVRFDATASTDADGTISTYGWSFGDGSTASGATMSHTYTKAGTYSATLTVTDNGGATHSASKTVTVTAAPSTSSPHIWLEAEAGSISAPMQVRSDAAASGGQCITVAAGNTSSNTPPSTGIARYNFTAATAGTYKLWGRVIAPSTADDSFWVRLDGGTWIKWNYVQLGSAWHWDEVHDSDNGNQALQVNLTAGAHTLEIGYRDDGALLDKLLITNKLDYVPTGVGATASTLALSGLPDPTDVAEATLAPNPATRQVNVRFTAPAAGPVWVQVVDGLGTVRLAQQQQVHVGHNELFINLPSLPSGTFVVRVLTQKQVLMTRSLVVQP